MMLKWQFPYQTCVPGQPAMQATYQTATEAGGQDRPPENRDQQRHSNSVHRYLPHKKGNSRLDIRACSILRHSSKDDSRSVRIICARF